MNNIEHTSLESICFCHITCGKDESVFITEGNRLNCREWPKGKLMRDK